nr:MAG TPA: baseplate assembly protein [Caudoviricetes sp.]
MIETSILVGQTASIDFAPASEYAEILQNVRTILATPVYSVPLDRSFGINAEYVDLPLPVAKAKIGQEIVTAIRKYEPRVSVTKITWEADQDGILKPKVQVRINDAT